MFLAVVNKIAMIMNFYSILLFSLLLLGSCRKYQGCRCSTEGEINGTHFNETNSYGSTHKLTKKEGKEWCKKYEENVNNSEISYVTQCKLIK